VLVPPVPPGQSVLAVIQIAWRDGAQSLLRREQPCCVERQRLYHRVWLTTQAKRSGILAGARSVPNDASSPKTLPKVYQTGQPSGIIADGCDEVCEIHTWAQGRFTSRLPGNPPRKQREAKHKSDIDVSEFWWASESIRAISRSASACLRCRLGRCATTRPVQRISARRI